MNHRPDICCKNCYIRSTLLSLVNWLFRCHRLKMKHFRCLPEPRLESICWRTRRFGVTLSVAVAIKSHSYCRIILPWYKLRDADCLPCSLPPQQTPCSTCRQAAVTCSQSIERWDAGWCGLCQTILTCKVRRWAGNTPQAELSETACVKMSERSSTALLMVWKRKVIARLFSCEWFWIWRKYWGQECNSGGL